MKNFPGSDQAVLRDGFYPVNADTSKQAHVEPRGESPQLSQTPPKGTQAVKPLPQDEVLSDAARGDRRRAVG